jgi:hypothetical protein
MTKRLSIKDETYYKILGLQSQYKQKNLSDLLDEMNRLAQANSGKQVDNRTFGTNSPKEQNAPNAPDIPIEYEPTREIPASSLKMAITSREKMRANPELNMCDCGHPRRNHLPDDGSCKNVNCVCEAFKFNDDKTEAALTEVSGLRRKARK